MGIRGQLNPLIIKIETRITELVDRGHHEAAEEAGSILGLVRNHVIELERSERVEREEQYASSYQDTSLYWIISELQDRIADAYADATTQALEDVLSTLETRHDWDQDKIDEYADEIEDYVSEAVRDTFVDDGISV